MYVASAVENGLVLARRAIHVLGSHELIWKQVWSNLLDTVSALDVVVPIFVVGRQIHAGPARVGEDRRGRTRLNCLARGRLIPIGLTIDPAGETKYLEPSEESEKDKEARSHHHNGDELSDESEDFRAQAFAHRVASLRLAYTVCARRSMSGR